MTPGNDQVVGYFAYMRRDQVICTEVDACVISGTSEAMRLYVEEVHPGQADNATVRKTRFGEIMDGLRRGAAYAFDEGAYQRFYPLARAAGVPVAPADFREAHQKALRFFTVRPSWVQ